MDKYLRNIWSASAELEMIQFQTDQAHDGLVQAMCEAMAARMSPADVAAAANMSLSELFDTLRRRSTVPSAENNHAVHDS
ncbi:MULTISPECIES: hypothetical protein [unclassified Pseudarthrobacter]|uniref:hypothetical protein n=1 Tax=unclassified Pseudarthrobacter TaxID=2647000 RepID=UPI0011321972|nr:hypothetical protein [Pseudarthrobacter sp. NIBRBAC000502772]QDG66941.1 hypothetical protein NIBR502772_12670 [Pseudarthrobacter sp. NIBRBAC000502772]